MGVTMVVGASKKGTAPGLPTWSPTVVLPWPDVLNFTERTGCGTIDVVWSFLTLSTLASIYSKKLRDKKVSTTTTSSTTCTCDDLRDDVSADSSKHSGEEYSSIFSPGAKFVSEGERMHDDVPTFNLGKTPESGIPPSYRATRRYTKVHLGFCLRFSMLIGQIGRVPLFGAGPRRDIRSRLFRLAVAAL